MAGKMYPFVHACILHACMHQVTDHGSRPAEMVVMECSSINSVLLCDVKIGMSITCAKDKSHGGDKAKSEDMEPKKSFINWLQQHQCISCGINGESLITRMADSVSLSHREEIVKEGQEPPGDINCHNQREQHRTAACAEFILLCLHTAAA